MNPFHKITARLPACLFYLAPFLASVTWAAQPIILDFSKSDNLKMVYDAGLRPWRLTYDSCRIEEASLQIILPQANAFPLNVSFAAFDVYADYSFSSVGFVTKRLSVDDAVAKVKEIAQAVGIDTAGLVEFAEQEKKSPGSSKNSAWRGYAKRKIPSISVALATYPQMVGVNALVMFDINWGTGGIPPKMFTKPMTPPPGYENVSMAPPPHDPNTKTYPPPLDWPNRSVQAQAKPTPQGNSNPISAPAPTAAPAAPASPAWLWLLLAFIVAALVVIFRFLRRK